MSPFARVSEFDSNDDSQSGFSFNRQGISQEYTNPFESASNMFLTIIKPKPNNVSGAYSSKAKTNKFIQNKFKKLHE
jgi:hypothetical protein